MAFEREDHDEAGDPTGRSHLDRTRLDELARVEHRFRLLAENASDVVVETSVDGQIRWASPSIEHVLGWAPDDLVGRSAFDLVVPADREIVEAGRRDVAAGATIVDLRCRVMSSSGSPRWTSLRGQPVTDDGVEGGSVSAIVVGLRDCHEEVIVERALRTLSIGNGLLVRAGDEQTLLDEMCENAVSQGGYLFAWYGRPQDDADKTVLSVAMAKDHRDFVDDIRISWADDELGQGPTGTALRTGRTTVVADFAADLSYRPWFVQATERGFRSSVSLPVRVHGEVDGALVVYAGEVQAFTERAVATLEDLAMQLGAGIERLRDAVRLGQALKDQALLLAAVDQAAEAIVVTDPTPTIVYANPATLRASGYALDEVLGRDPRMFQSGLHDRRFYEQMWEKLTAGQAWHGVLVNRRKDGELYEEDATIAPVLDPDGTLVAYVAAKHDLSTERQLEADLVREQRSRDDIVDLMRRVRNGPTIEASAAELCREVARLDFVDVALVLLRRDDGDLVPIASGDAAAGPIGDGSTGPALGEPLAIGASRLLDGPEPATWWLDLTGLVRVDDATLVEAVAGPGVAAAAFARISWAGEAVGMLVVASAEPDAPQWMPLRLPAIEELGSFAGTLLGDQAARTLERGRRRSAVAATIAGQRYRPVFQPVVDAGSGALRGYEALTRFDDGTRPDLAFLDAAAVGLGEALELACAQAAVATASALPADLWLSVNLSPEAILGGHARRLRDDAGRDLVIEVTEHRPIASYLALREAIEAAPGCRVAVDDAGAGYASLRHILELQPDFVKLDIALVHDIDRDPARQALAAGLCHFAAQTHTRLIAEGVETAAEAATLGDLGVDLMQGYHFGRPGPLS